MENCIHIGGRVDKDSALNLGDYVAQIFRVGKETHMEQSTIVEALKLVIEIANAKNVTVSDSSFFSTTAKTVELKKLEELDNEESN